MDSAALELRPQQHTFPMSSTPAPAASPASEPPPHDGAALIARQAIVDAQRAVFGYELYDRSTEQDTHTAASDAALLFNALSHGDTEALVGTKIIFINCTHESLVSGHLELIHPDKVVLEVPPARRRQCRRHRKHGGAFHFTDAAGLPPGLQSECAAPGLCCNGCPWQHFQARHEGVQA